MGLGIDINGSRELQAAVLGIRRAEKEIQKQIRTQTREKLLPEWQQAVRERAETRLEQRVLVDTARVKMSNQNVRLSSATVGRKLSGGLDPKTQAAAAEFGADRAVKGTYTARSRKGKSFKVTRHTRAQLRGPRRGGYAVYPAAKAMIPRFAALWVQTVVRTFHEGIEGK
jgi:hypothetical protein